MKNYQQTVGHKYVMKDMLKRKDYKVTFNMNTKKYALLKEKCEEEGITVSGFLNSHIENFIKDKLEVSERDGFYTLENDTFDNK